MKKEIRWNTREEFDEYMCKTYPNIFEQRKLPMNQTCMCWGFCVQKGWYNLLDELCKKLQAIENRSNVRASAVQVKEKFGTLRFYINVKNGSGIPDEKSIVSEEEAHVWYDIIHDVVDDAERKSGHTCEECGDDWAEQITVHGWVTTLCKVCRAPHVKEMEEAEAAQKAQDEAADIKAYKGELQIT